MSIQAAFNPGIDCILCFQIIYNHVRKIMCRNMNEVMLQRTGSADGKEITPLALGFVILGHPVHHMNILAERYFPLL